MIRSCFVAAFFFIAASSSAAQSSQLGLRLPKDFEVTQFAGSKLANDIYTLTIDPQGRIVVAGRGYIRILIDENKDGKAERAIQFADSPKDGAMGLLWEKDTLYVTGDGGLRRFRDRNGDDRADGPPELIRKLKTGREHGAHDIRRGPDSWLYVLCGNHTGVDKSYSQLPTSPIANPVGGCVLRFTPDLKNSEIVAHGFRNAYGMDFNPDGELFTYDSDNERSVSLPWYEHTRFYHVMPGGFYGWLSPQRAQWWRCPPYFLDVVAPLAYLDRGSPTGVACYRHVQFPKSYQRGMFACDWTFGRVWFLRLIPSGSTYRCTKEKFIEAEGDNGFAPTGLAVHPRTGDLFIAVGGRGTRGAVYRVRYKKRGKIDPKKVAALQPRPRLLPWPIPKNFKRIAGVKIGLLNDLQYRRHLLRIERYLRFHKSALRNSKLNWKLERGDKYIRQVSARIIAVHSPQDAIFLLDSVLANLGEGKHVSRLVQSYSLASYKQWPKSVLRIAARRIDSRESAKDRSAYVRLIQLALGDLVSPNTKTTIWEGYSLRKKQSDLAKAIGNLNLESALRKLRKAFPSGDDNLDRELSRMFALIEDAEPAALEKVVRKLAGTKHPVDQIHYLAVLARLRSRRDAHTTGLTANVLLSLNQRIAQRKMTTDRHWPLRIGELYRELAAKDKRLHATMLAHADFGRSEHALFARSPGFDRKQAALRFLRNAENDKTFKWNAQVAQIIGTLPAEKSLPVLRKAYRNGGMQDVVLPVLARKPQEIDRGKFIAGLKSPQLSTVRVGVRALQQLAIKKDTQTMLACLLALNRLPPKLAKDLQKELSAYLKKMTGQAFSADRQAWNRWFAETHPKLAARLTNPDGVDLKKWQRRLAKLDWTRGNAERGRRVYVKARCAACHTGNTAVGPDLRGVGKRFSRGDLVKSILQPGRDVSDRYRPTMVATRTGKVYQGMVIYDAVDSLILQTGVAETIRLAGKQIISRQRVATSLMPAGLMDELSDGEIVDLVAYLRGLK